MINQKHFEHDRWPKRLNSMGTEINDKWHGMPLEILLTIARKRIKAVVKSSTFDHSHTVIYSNKSNSILIDKYKERKEIKPFPNMFL